MTTEAAKKLFDADIAQMWLEFRQWQFNETLRIATAKTADGEAWNEEALETSILATKRAVETQAVQDTRDFIVQAAQRAGMPAYCLAALVSFALACERTGEDPETNAPIARELLTLAASEPA